jgi:putative nucleotidyltransferase with HDIG domain
MSLIQRKRPESVNEYITDFCRRDISSFLIKKLQVYHKETFLHSIRVAALCAELSAILGLREDDQEIIVRSALLHDVGVTKMEKRLVDKYGRFLNPEWRMLNNHCRLGFEMLKNSLLKPHLNLDLILYHHENLDGTGYFGLQDGQLCIGTRILRVADGYDSMTQSGWQGGGLSTSEAFEEMYRWNDIHYDPHVVEALFEMKAR